MSDLRWYFICALTPVLVVQLSKLSDFCAETSDFFAKDCQMIHTISIASRQIERRSQSSETVALKHPAN